MWCWCFGGESSVHSELFHVAFGGVRRFIKVLPDQICCQAWSGCKVAGVDGVYTCGDYWDEGGSVEVLDDFFCFDSS